MFLHQFSGRRCLYQGRYPLVQVISTPEGRFHLALASRYLAMLIASAVTCLVLALQWGRNTKAWNDKSVIIVRNIPTCSLPQKFDAELRSVFCFCGSHSRGSCDLREISRDIIWEIQHQLTSGNLLERKPGSTQRKSTKHPRLSVCYFE